MRAVFCPTAAFTQIAGKGRLRDGGSSCEKHRNVPAKKHLQKNTPAKKHLQKNILHCSWHL
jgi:hypothetical protein